MRWRLTSSLPIITLNLEGKGGERGLGGIMFWEYHGDYQGGLLDAINRVMRQ